MSLDLRMVMLRHEAGQAFAKYLKEGLKRHRRAQPSHICIRTADDSDFAAFDENALALGTVVRSVHGRQPLLWIKLDDPLIYDGYALEWLEITPPKPEHPKTGPQMLVYAKRNQKVCRRLARDNSGFSFRYQRAHAAQLAAQVTIQPAAPR